MEFDRFNREMVGAYRSGGWNAAKRLLASWRYDQSRPVIDRAYANVLWSAQVTQQEPWRLADALDLVEESFPVLQASLEGKVATVVTSLAICRHWADYDRAARYIYHALNLLERSEIDLWHGRLWLSLGQLEYQRGNLPDAKWFLRHANECHAQPGYGPFDEADRFCMWTVGLSFLGEVHLCMNDVESAVAVCKQISEIPQNSATGRIHKLRAHLALVQEEWETLDSELVALQPWAEKNADLELEGHELAFQACHAQGNIAEALGHLRVAQEKAVKLGRMGFMQRLLRINAEYSREGVVRLA